MKISKNTLNRIISEEIRLLKEGCGCGCGGKSGGCGQDSHKSVDELDNFITDESDIEYFESDPLGYGMSSSHTTTEHEFLTRDEALKAVVAIAMSTSCPVTRDELLSSIQSLMV